MKIQHLISRFESQDESFDAGDKEDDMPTVEDSIVTYNLTKTPTKDRTRPRSASPGHMRKAFQALRGRKGESEHTPSKADDEDEEDEDPAPLSTRVDDVIKSITDRSSHSLRHSSHYGSHHQKDFKNSSSHYKPRSSMSHTSEESGSSSSDIDGTFREEKDGFSTSSPSVSRREYLISEHSNRTLVVDNKKIKSQPQVIPEAPWSSRTLNSTTSTRPEYTYYEKQVAASAGVEDESKTEKQARQAEYGEFDLKGLDESGICDAGKQAAKVNKDDKNEPKKEGEMLPPEVVAMVKATEKTQKKSRRRSRSTDGHQGEQGEGNDDQGATKEKRRSSRRQSPGLLGRRRCPSPGTLADTPSRSREANKQEASSEVESGYTVPWTQEGSSDAKDTQPGSWRLRKPARSRSVGGLKNDSRSSRATRKERKARSQSPGEERNKWSEEEAGRKTRSGRKKEENGNADADARGQGEQERTESTKPRRTRGQSPGTLRGGTKSDRKKPTEEDDGDNTSSNPDPSGSKVPSRGRSIDMTGNILRDYSPGDTGLRRSRHKDRSQSPGKLRSKNKEKDGSQSPGKLRSKSKDRASRSQSPGRLKKDSDQKRGKSPGTLSKGSERSSEDTSDTHSTPTKRSSRTKSPGKYQTDIVVQASTTRASPRSSRALKRSSGQEAPLPKRKSSILIKSPSSDIVVPAQASAKPWARSPGTLSRPATTLRTTQARKSQSMFTPRLSGSQMSNDSKIASELPASARRKYARQTSSGAKLEKPQRSSSFGIDATPELLE